jgi:hypothetical protein
MSGVTPASAFNNAEDEPEGNGITLTDLVERFGEASGTKLFERMAGQLRRGNMVYGTTVRAARKSFSAALTPGQAQLVMPRRSADAHGGKADEGMVMIALADLEAVVKAGQAEFDWAAEFAPRPDLPVATTPVVIRSGAPGQRMLKP